MTTPTFDPKNVTLEQVQRLNKSMIDDGLVTPDHYYLDLRTLKDFHLGAVIAAIFEHGPDTRSALYAELEPLMTDYQKRSFDDDAGLATHPCYARGMEMLHDPAYQTAVIMASPMTQLLKTIDAHIVINANHSHIAEKFQKRNITETTYQRIWADITFHVNVYPFKTESDAARFVAAFLVDRYGVNVDLISKAPYEIPGELFIQCEEYFLYTPDGFLESPGVQGLLEPLANMKKQFFCTPIFGSTKKTEWSEARLKLERRSLKAYMDMFITLDWLNPESYCPFPARAPSPEYFLY